MQIYYFFLNEISTMIAIAKGKHEFLFLIQHLNNKSQSPNNDKCSRVHATVCRKSDCVCMCVYVKQENHRQVSRDHGGVELTDTKVKPTTTGREIKVI